MSSSSSASSKASIASSSIGSIRTHSATSTEIFFHEPFETYKVKVHTLCQSIGLGEATVEWMDGGSFNRVSKLTFASGDQFVIRVPRDILPGLISHAENVKDQVGIVSFGAKLFPVPEIIAYDITADNAIEAPYIIQKFAPGQSLAEVLRGDLTMEDRFQIASIIADILVRMEKVSFPTPGRLVTGPGIPDRCDDFSQLSIGTVIAPFKIVDGEVLESTLSPSVADFMGSILDTYYATSQVSEKSMVSRWERLREINQEMKSKGLLTCQKPVLWHWDFQPRNIIVDRTPDNSWKLTAVLDWDGVLSVPRVLTREPPVWLWTLGDQTDQGSDGNGLQLARKTTCQEESIKQHFEDCLKASICFEDYYADAYDRGRWARRLFDYLYEPFNDSVDWRTYDAFVKDWEAYCLEHAISENSGNNAPTPAATTGDAKVFQSTHVKRRSIRSYIRWLQSVFKKLFMWRRSDT